MIRTVVVDDEPLARKTLRTLLEPEPDLEVVAEAANGEEALAAIREHRPDLAFLDIKMPDLSGFEVLRRLEPEQLPFVVFVTAYEHFALEAFEANALAYLLKPFDDVRFGEVVDRCRRFFGTNGAAVDQEELLRRIRALLAAVPGGSGAAAQGVGPQERLVVRTGGRTRLVDVDAIDWIEARGNYARLYCRGDAEHLVSRSLGDLEETLDERFVRIHRSTIVNLDRIVELRTDNYRDFQVLLEDGQTLRLSRTYRAALEDALGDRI